MADSFVQLPPDSTGKLLDTSQLTVGANTVQRERMNIADPTTAAAMAAVENTTPGASDYGLVVRTAGATTIASDVAQGSTTAGQIGGLIQAAVTTSQPTYTSTQTNPLSMDTHGSVRTAALSGTAASSLADNQANQSFFTSNTAVSQVLSVGGWGYGGAFSGTTNAALTGWSKARQPTVFKNIAATAVTAGTPVSVWTPGTGNKFRFLGFHVSLSVAGSVLFEDATGVEFMRTPLMAAGIGQASAKFGGYGYLSTAANNHLFIDVTATGSVSGYIFGTEE